MNKRTFILFFIAIFIAFLFWYSNTLQDTFFITTDYLKELAFRNHFLAVLLFLGTSVLGALISPFTNIPLVPIAMLIWGPLITTMLLLAGWLMGGIFSYIIGRYFGYEVISFFIPKERINEWGRVVKENMNFLTGLLVRLTFPAELGYAFGIIHFPFFSYLFITFLSELPFAIISVYASEAVLSGDSIKFLSLIGLLFVIIFIAFRITRRKSI